MLTKVTASVKATQAKNTDTVEASRSMKELLSSRSNGSN
jgi:hypothetical protein